jgi:hypothetical protein
MADEAMLQVFFFGRHRPSPSIETNIGWTELLSSGAYVNQQIGVNQSMLKWTIMAHSRTTVCKVLVNAP